MSISTTFHRELKSEFIQPLYANNNVSYQVNSINDDLDTCIADLYVALRKIQDGIPIGSPEVKDRLDQVFHFIAHDHLYEKYDTKTDASVVRLMSSTTHPNFSSVETQLSDIQLIIKSLEKEKTSSSDNRKLQTLAVANGKI